MDTQDALEVVLDLAQQNVLSESAADTPELQEERERQLSALRRVRGFAGGYEMWQYDGSEGDGYNEEDTATLTVDRSPDITDITVEHEGVVLNLGLEFNEGDLVVMFAATDQTTEEGEPLFGDAIMHARFSLEGVDVEHVYGREQAFFENPAASE